MLSVLCSKNAAVVVVVVVVVQSATKLIKRDVSRVIRSSAGADVASRLCPISSDATRYDAVGDVLSRQMSGQCDVMALAVTRYHGR